MPSAADSTKNPPSEHALRMRNAKLCQLGGKALRAQRGAEEANRREAQALAELAEDIAALAPLLTDDQISALRPIFAGTLDDAPEAGAA